MEAVTQSGARARRAPKKPGAQQVTHRHARSRTEPARAHKASATVRRFKTSAPGREDGREGWRRGPGRRARFPCKSRRLANRGDAHFRSVFCEGKVTEHRQEGVRQESAKTRTQSRERRAEEPRARTGATLRHRPRTFTCKSRRTANGGAPHVCDVIREERRRGPQGDPRRGPREGRSRAARRRMATPLRKRQKASLRKCPPSAHPVGDS